MQMLQEHQKQSDFFVYKMRHSNNPRWTELLVTSLIPRFYRAGTEFKYSTDLQLISDQSVGLVKGLLLPSSFVTKKDVQNQISL